MEWDENSQSFITVEEDSYEYEGPLAECKGGGGGASGEVKYPAYQEAWHTALLGTAPTAGANQFGGVFPSIIASNPYTAAVASNPTADLEGVQTLMNLIESTFAQNSPLGDYNLHSNAAITQFDTKIFNDAYVDAETIAYTDVTKMQYAKGVTAFSAGMADINAVYSSSFIQGLANIVNERNKDVSNFRTKMQTEYYKARIDYITNAQKAIGSLVAVQMSSAAAIGGVVLQATQHKIKATQDWYTTDLDYDIKDANWDLDILQKAASGMSALSGGQFVPNEPSSNGVAGAMSGAASGFAMGGPIGAGIGGLMGLFG
tara:strand:- start:8709 stop:9656 length:948 start_codon:yes stop_codon:yes gene_type:complete